MHSVCQQTVGLSDLVARRPTRIETHSSRKVDLDSLDSDVLGTGRHVEMCMDRKGAWRNLCEGRPEGMDDVVDKKRGG